MKHFNNLKRIKEMEGDIIEIKNFLSEKELYKLNDYANSGKNVWIDRKDTKKYCFNFSNSSPVRSLRLWDNLFKKTILTKLKKIFKDVDFYVDEKEFPPHISHTFTPVRVHADTGKNNSDKIIYKQILIPLKIEPKQKEKKAYTYSVFFKNRWYGPAASFHSQSTKYGEYRHDLIEDKNGKFVTIPNLESFYDHLEKNTNKEFLFNSGYFKSTSLLKKEIKSLMSMKRYNIRTNALINKKKKFPKKTYDKYLSHINKNDLNGLVFWKSMKWTCGNAIIWDRSIVHSSDNFVKSNTLSKRGIAILFNIKK